MDDLAAEGSLEQLEDAQAGISLIRLTLSTMHLQPLILNDNRDFVPWFNSDSSKIWLSNSILNLGSIDVGEHDSDSHDFSSNRWSININTGQLIPLSTPTLTP